MSKLTNENNNTINEEVDIENTVNVELTDEKTVETVFEEGGTTEQTDDFPVDVKEQELQLLKGKLEEADNRYLRLQADFDNFRRRTRIDLEASQKYRAQVGS